MADKDELEPSETGDPASPVTPEDKAGDTGTTADRSESGAEPEDRTDEEFDAIVRNSGVTSASDAEAEDAKVLEPAGVGAVGAGGSRPARAKRQDKAPKDAPTGKRDQVAKRERTGPVKLVKQSVGELRKVVYPTGPQLANYFVVVLVFVLFIIAYVSLLDLGLGWAIFKIFS